MSVFNDEELEQIKGYFLFTRANGIMARISWWYQQRRRKTNWLFSNHLEHAAIIGEGGSIIESRLRSEGVITKRTLEEILSDESVTVYITRPDGDWDDKDVDRALTVAMSYALKETSYDWLSIITFGLLQSNGSMICSELAAAYYNELIRKTDLPMFDEDSLILPVDVASRSDVFFVREGV